MNYFNYIKGIFGNIFGDIFGEFHLDNEISNKLFMKIDKINELRIPQLRKDELIEREFDGVYYRGLYKRFNKIKTIKEKYKVGFILKYEEASKVGKQYIIYQRKMKEIRKQKENKCAEYFNDVEKLTDDNLDCIIDYFEKYKLLLKYEHFNCDRNFVLQSVKNYEIIRGLEPKNEEIKEHLNDIIEIYKKNNIKFAPPQ